jgi:acetyl-CoA acyltransferase
MSKDKAEEMGIEPKMRLVAFAYAGVKPEVMGLGPIPATKKALKIAGLKFEDLGLIELNEAFAVQAVAFMNEFGMQFPDDPRLNVYGGAIAFGHPLASSGVRLACHLIHAFAQHPEVKYGLTTMCVGLGQGGAVIWKNSQRNGNKEEKKEHEKEEEEKKDKE